MSNQFIQPSKSPVATAIAAAHSLYCTGARPEGEEGGDPAKAINKMAKSILNGMEAWMQYETPS